MEPETHRTRDRTGAERGNHRDARGNHAAGRGNLVSSPSDRNTEAGSAVCVGVLDTRRGAEP